MSQPPGSAGDALAVFFGWLLVVVGVLIAGLGGLCTLALLTDRSSEARMYAVICVVPVGIGAAILLPGLLILRDRRKRRRAWRPGPEDLARFSDGTPPPAPAPDPAKPESPDDR